MKITKMPLLTSFSGIIKTKQKLYAHQTIYFLVACPVSGRTRDIGENREDDGRSRRYKDVRRDL